MPALAQTVPISSFWREDGTQDTEALLEAAEGGWHEEAVAQEVSASYLRLVANFLARRIEEASIWEATGNLPDNVAYNRQAWWRLELWLVYLAARDEAMRKRAES